MDRKIRIVIADDNLMVREMIADSVGDDADIEVVGMASEGNEAIAMIREHRPNVVLLDLVMPNVDGLDVMETIINDYAYEGSKPYFIIISAAGKEDIISQALQAGASYFFMKPFNGEALIKRIKQLCNVIPKSGSVPVTHKTQIQEPSDSNPDNDIVMLLRSMNVPVKMIGYKYLKDAILIALDAPESLMSVTKDVYPILAEKYGTSPTNVERNIRYIIESTWERSKKSTRSDKVDTMFGGIVKKPTNSEFILTCSEWLRYGDR